MSGAIVSTERRSGDWLRVAELRAVSIGHACWSPMYIPPVSDSAAEETTFFMIFQSSRRAPLAQSLLFQLRRQWAAARLLALG